VDLVIADRHLIDEQSRVGLAQSWIVGSKTTTEQAAESTNHGRRNAALAGGELALETRVKTDVKSTRARRGAKRCPPVHGRAWPQAARPILLESRKNLPFVHI